MMVNQYAKIIPMSGDMAYIYGDGYEITIPEGGPEILVYPRHNEWVVVSVISKPAKDGDGIMYIHKRCVEAVAQAMRCLV